MGDTESISTNYTMDTNQKDPEVSTAPSSPSKMDLTGMKPQPLPIAPNMIDGLKPVRRTKIGEIKSLFEPKGDGSQIVQLLAEIKDTLEGQNTAKTTPNAELSDIKELLLSMVDRSKSNKALLNSLIEEEGTPQDNEMLLEIKDMISNMIDRSKTNKSSLDDLRGHFDEQITDRLSQVCKTVEQQSKDIHDKMKTLLDSKVNSALLSELDSKLTKIVDHETEELKSLEATVSNLTKKSDIQGIELKLTDFSDKMERLQDSNDLKNSKLEEKLDKLVQELTKNNTKLESRLELREKELEQKIDEKDGIIDELKQEVHDLHKKLEYSNEKHTNEMEAKNNEILSLRQLLNDSNMQNTAIREELSTLNAQGLESSQLQASIEEMKREKSVLTKTLISSCARIKSQQELFQLWNDRTEDVKSNLLSLHETLKSDRSFIIPLKRPPTEGDYQLQESKNSPQKHAELHNEEAGNVSNGSIMSPIFMEKLSPKKRIVSSPSKILSNRCLNSNSATPSKSPIRLSSTKNFTEQEN
ncbi:BA75_00037T0 [Komagataella pastoris]|uniref:BA75_00037T0 n=1 Tax=Komagataella pastoris TaxID=4922 RepID=A0A1B2J8S7_PICPA|nr:BA75_00037T0 [Komagataella pastoris]